MRSARFLGVATFVLAVAMAPTAAADDAGQLFDRGLAAFEAGRVAEGCPLLQRSYDIEARPGTIFTLAECEAKWGKNASALQHYHEYLARYLKLAPSEQGRQRARQRIAETQVQSLEATVPSYTFVHPASAAEGGSVRVDGAVLPSLQGVRLDPGEHVIVVDRGVGEKQELKLVAVAGDKKRLELSPGLPNAPDPLELKSDKPKFELGPPPAPETASQPALERAPASKGGGSSHTAAWIVGGLGVVGLGFGTVTGVMAMSKASITDSHCQDVFCDATGKKAADEGKTLAWISTAGFGVGVLGVGAAIVMLVTDSGSGGNARAWTPVLVGAPGGGFVGAARSF
jgi:hypothetical protein